jgi:catecholate siderophore receptor
MSVRKTLGRRASQRRMKLVALATMAAYGTVGSIGALAQQATVEPKSTTAPAQLPVRRFRIASGPLDRALDQFREQSGLKLKLEISMENLTALHSDGVVGLYGNDVAIRQVLQGTGLSFHFVGADTISVGLRDNQTVNVTAALADSVGMAKFTEPLLDTPQTVEVIPEFVLHDEQNRTLMDAVRNVPGISLAAGESGAQGDNLTIRGFTARNDIYLDGIRDFGSYYRDSFNLEQVEVLEGPAGVQFGRGSTGGVINQESKEPTLGKFVNAETEIGTDLTRRLTLDVNEPLPDLVNSAAVRFNAMANEGGVAGRPYDELRRFGIAPSVSLGINQPSKLTVSYFHITESDTPDYGLPWFENGPAHGVSRHAYFGFPDEHYLRTDDDILTLRASHSFDKPTTLICTPSGDGRIIRVMCRLLSRRFARTLVSALQWVAMSVRFQHQL